jgi:hypothetical protein
VSLHSSVVLDTPAVRAYASGTHDVGDLLARTSARHDLAIVPALCLAEAYRTASAEEALVLDLLHNLPVTVITPVVADDCAVLGGWARRLGRIDLAHAALASSVGRVPIVTSDGDTVRAFLTKNWPIIDL